MRVVVQASLSKKQDPISKISRVKRDGGIVCMVEHLPSKYEPRIQTPVPLPKKCPDIWEAVGK
jgi:hypothetical protein